MITQEYLKECFDYNPDTGILSWRIRPKDHFEDESRRNAFCMKYSNKPAGTIFRTAIGKKYSRVMLFRKLYATHRVIWFWVYGEFPKNQIDHEDGNGINNRISNLRDATRLENARNQRTPRNNTSGMRGVHWYPPTEKWGVQIIKNKKQSHVGYFIEKWDAYCARKSAEHKAGYHPNHGSVRPL